jgi:hypothetical protein
VGSRPARTPRRRSDRRTAQPGQERLARRRRSRARPCSVPAGQRIFGWAFLQKIE